MALPLSWSPRVLSFLLVLVVSVVFPTCAAADVSGAGADESSSQAYGPLQRGASYAGAFASQSDVDYLSFTAAAGDTLQFTVSNTTQVCQDPNDAGCPVYATLMDSTGQAQLGGSASDAGTIATYGDTETFAWTFAQPGTYYLLLESDGDLQAGAPSYSVSVAAASGGGAGGNGSGAGGGAGGGAGVGGNGSGAGGGAGGGAGVGGGSSGSSSGGQGQPSSVLVRSLRVTPHQRGRYVTAALVLGRPARWVRASLLSTLARSRRRVLARHLYRRLGPGTHRLVVALPYSLWRRLRRGAQLSVLVIVTIDSPSGRQSSYQRRVTLTR
jgi:hypothetical protein